MAAVAGPVRGGVLNHNVVQGCKQEADVPYLLRPSPRPLRAATAATAMATKKREVTARTVTGVR